MYYHPIVRTSIITEGEYLGGARFSHIHLELLTAAGIDRNLRPSESHDFPNRGTTNMVRGHSIKPYDHAFTTARNIGYIDCKGSNHADYYHRFCVDADPIDNPKEIHDCNFAYRTHQLNVLTYQEVVDRIIERRIGFSGNPYYIVDNSPDSISKPWVNRTLIDWMNEIRKS